MALSSIRPAAVEGDQYDYSHLLPEAWRDKVRLHVEHHGDRGPGYPTFRSVLTDRADPDRVIGKATGYIQNDSKGKYLRLHSDIGYDLEPGQHLVYRGKGLGKPMYTAALAHALNHLGIDRVGGGRGSVASVSAVRTHASVARDHQLEDFKPTKPRTSDDGMVQRYKYTLKSEPRVSRRCEGGLSPGGKVLEGVLEAAQLLMALNKRQGDPRRDPEHVRNEPIGSWLPGTPR